MKNSSNSSDFFDDANSDIDVPVYRKDTEKKADKPAQKRDPYAMTGRARPQRIEPKKPESVAAPEPDPAFEIDEPAPAAAAAVPVSKKLAEPKPEPEPAPAPAAAPVVTEPVVTEPVVNKPAVAEPVKEDEDTEPVSDKPVREKRGTLGFGLLILRLVIGGLLLVHGLQILFAFGGHGGLSVVERQLQDHSHADLLAVGVSVGAVVAGASLILGLLTPLGAAVGTVAAGFFALHFLRAWDGGYWPAELDTKVQMWGLLAAGSVALLFTGPGRIALDRSRGWATRPLASAWVFALIAAGGLAALWFLTA